MPIGHHAALVTIANVAGQSLQLAALPLIARYVSPSIFGMFTLFVGACVLACVLAGLRYDAAIVVARDHSQALRLARLVFLLGVATAVMTLAIGWLGLVQLGTFDATQAALLATLAASYVLANTAVRVATNWLTRLKSFGWVGIVQFTVVVLTLGLQLCLLALEIDPLLALASGFAIGQAGAASLAFAFAAPRQRWIGRGRRRDLATVATRFVNFPRYMIVYGLNSALRERLVHAIIGWGAGAAVLGHFALAQRIVGAPHAFMHGGIGLVLLAHARDISKAEVAKLAASLIELSCLVLTPLIIFIAFNASSLAASLFGGEWVGLATHLPWLAITYLVLACTGFIDRLFELYVQQRVALRLDIGFSAMILTSLVLVATSGNGLAMTATFCGIYLVYEVYWTWCAYRANGLPLQSLRRVGLFFCGQFLFWIVVSWVVMDIDLLTTRAAVFTAFVPILFTGYYRWMGGRDVVRHVFGKTASLV